jgi:tetratricopeptide (TPR) repeat protein
MATAALAEGLSLQQRGYLDEAMACYRGYLRERPRDRQALYLLGSALYQQGHWQEASELMKSALDLGLKDAAAHFHYGNVLLHLGRVEEALEQFRRALRLRPAFSQALHQLGNLLYETDAFAEAADTYNKLLALDANDWQAHFNLAHTYYRLGDYAGAARHLRKALTLKPNDAETHASLATVLELLQALPEAEAQAGKALAIDPGNCSALTVLARLARRRKELDRALAFLARVNLGSAPERSLITFWNEQGHILDGLGRYQEAFSAMARANRLLAEHRRARYDFREFCEPLECAERGQAVPKPSTSTSSEVPEPVFIVGFPRSGTSLLEQMLASHGSIAGAGELKTIFRLERRMAEELHGPFPDCLGKLRPDFSSHRRLLGKWRKSYLDEARSASGWRGEALVTDKLPFNLFHLTGIDVLFPRAPILHMVRHPLDTLLSCFFTNFLDANEWSYSLHDIAELYARSFLHMERMREKLDLNYKMVRYEDLIQNPREILGAILDFLGQPWDENCLNFHESGRLVRTASYEQVTRPIYSTSKHRFKKYIDAIDGHIIDLLQPAINKLDYSI